MTKYLGIDYGLIHIGLSMSEHTLATPLKSLSNNKFLLSNLESIIKHESITIIVCGIPEGRLAPIIKDFAQELKRKIGIKVILHPETLSTQEAISSLRAGRASIKKLKNDHAYAACLILEDYLDLINSPNPSI